MARGAGGRGDCNGFVFSPSRPVAALGGAHRGADVPGKARPPGVGSAGPPAVPARRMRRAGRVHGRQRGRRRRWGGRGSPAGGGPAPRTAPGRGPRGAARSFTRWRQDAWLSRRRCPRATAPGCAATKSRIIAAHPTSSSSTISTPCSASQSCPPLKVRASPITTREIPNCRTSPEQYQHGDSVVTIVLPRYDRCLPAARNADVSACIDGSPSCTRRLRPRPSSEPSAAYSAAPIGMPPSASPARASATAVASHLRA